MSNYDTLGMIKQRLEILYQMVDELETSGGGGGGSTNYNELSNKPQINSHKLEGNKTAAQLGFSTVATTGSYADLTDKPKIPDLTNYYTKTDTDNEIERAIADLDVSSTSATGHVIRSIEQVDGKINAVAELVDTAPKIGSTKLITSDAVYTALSTKQNTLTFDTTPTNNSTNPVTSGGVYTSQQAQDTAIAKLVDAGAKNLLKNTGTTQTIRGITFTVNDDGTVTVNGTNTSTSAAVFYVNILPAATAASYNDCRLTGCPEGGSTSTYRLAVQLNSGSYTTYASDTGNGATISNVPSSDCRVGIFVYAGATVNNLVFKPMICTLENYVISSEYVPYAPSNRELYEMILALQNP